MEARNRLPPSRRGLYARRDILQLGALGVWGLSLPGFVKARGAAAAAAPAGRRRGTARSCIILFQQGGPAQHDTFDMKPEAPAEIRGEFRPIATSLPGYHICEHMPLLARQAHRLAIVPAGNHHDPPPNNARYAVLTT